MLTVFACRAIRLQNSVRITAFRDSLLKWVEERRAVIDSLAKSLDGLHMVWLHHAVGNGVTG